MCVVQRIYVAEYTVFLPTLCWKPTKQATIKQNKTKEKKPLSPVLVVSCLIVVITLQEYDYQMKQHSPVK